MPPLVVNLPPSLSSMALNLPSDEERHLDLNILSMARCMSNSLLRQRGGLRRGGAAPSAANISRPNDS
jgi:hypothetical protein